MGQSDCLGHHRRIKQNHLQPSPNHIQHHCSVLISVFHTNALFSMTVVIEYTLWFEIRVDQRWNSTFNSTQLSSVQFTPPQLSSNQLQFNPTTILQQLHTLHTRIRQIQYDRQHREYAIHHIRLSACWCVDCWFLRHWIVQSSNAEVACNSTRVAAKDDWDEYLLVAHSSHSLRCCRRSYSSLVSSFSHSTVNKNPAQFDSIWPGAA